MDASGDASSGMGAADGTSRRRAFLKGALGASAVALLAACAPAAPTAAPKPAATTASASTTVPAAAPATAPAAAQPTAAAASPTQAAPAVKPDLAKVTILNTVPLDPTVVPENVAYHDLQNQYGVQADLQDVTGADIAIKSLVAGQAQFVLSSLASGVLAVGQGQQIKAVVPAASASYFTLVTSADVREWKDLVGKQVGITATSDASYWNTVMQLKKAGVDPAGVQWITVRGSSARAEALQAGKIDAGQVLVGQALELLKNPKFKRFADVAKDFPNLLFSAFWTSDQLIKDHPSTVQAFANVVQQEHRNAQDKAKYLANAKDLLGKQMDDQAIADSYDILKSMNIWDPTESRWSNDAGEFSAHALADYQAVEKYVPFSQWATTQFADAARQQLGPYKA